MFSFSRTVNFYETDSMKIVHHANYVKYMEEARIAWARAHGLMDFQDVHAASQFAVIDCHVSYIKPALFGEELETYVQARVQKAKIIFEYKICSKTRIQLLLSEGRTRHVNVSEDLRPQQPRENLIQIMEKEKWIETWLLNL